MCSVADLEDRLSRPTPALVDDLRALDGDLIVLGAGGKLGPSLVTLAVRGIAESGGNARVFAVSRFRQREAAERLAAAGAEVIEADLSDDCDLAALPDAANVVYLAGAKFGTTDAEAATWHTNTYLPGRVAERYRRSRIAALSTGNVYPLVPVTRPATEDTPPEPVGEYAMSCLGRERVLTAMSLRHRTPMSLLRLNYAVEPRYGVLHDIAHAVWRGEPIDLRMGYVNVVWQGYANTVTLRSLAAATSPPWVVNVTGTETLPVRELAARFGRLLDRRPHFDGRETDTALLSDATRCHRRFGPPQFDVDELIDLIARWVRDDLPSHGKPTLFQRRDGRF